MFPIALAALDSYFSNSSNLLKHLIIDPSNITDILQISAKVLPSHHALVRSTIVTLKVFKYSILF